MLRYMYTGCLVGMDLCIYSLHLMVLLIFNKESKFMIPEILQEFLSLSFTSFNSVNSHLCLLILQVNIQYVLDPDFILWTRIITSSL